MRAIGPTRSSIGPFIPLFSCMDTLSTLCKDVQRQTTMRNYKKIASTMDASQVYRAVTIIQELQFIRDQFRLLFEFLEDHTCAELRAMEKDARRGTVWVRAYMDLLFRQQRSASGRMVAACRVFAATHGHTQDHLYQLEHPALYQQAHTRKIIAQPRGPRISLDEAMGRFEKLVP